MRPGSLEQGSNVVPGGVSWETGRQAVTEVTSAWVPSPTCLAEESWALCRHAQWHKTQTTQRQTAIETGHSGRKKRLHSWLQGLVYGNLVSVCWGLKLNICNMAGQCAWHRCGWTRRNRSIMTVYSFRAVTVCQVLCYLPFKYYIIISEYQLCKVHTTHIFRDETAGVTALSK